MWWKRLTANEKKIEKKKKMTSSVNRVSWRLLYRKIPKISPGAYIFQRPFFRGLYSSGLSTEGSLRFKIDWTSLIVGGKFIVFALFYFVFEGNFLVQAPRGHYIWRGDLTERLLRYRFGGLIFRRAYPWRGLSMKGPIHGGAYPWRGLFSEFYGRLFL